MKLLYIPRANEKFLFFKPPKANKKPLGYVPFKQDGPFIPSNPGKRDGGCRAGGFAKWPSYAPKDAYSRIGKTWIKIFKKSFRGNKTKSCILRDSPQVRNI